MNKNWSVMCCGLFVAITIANLATAEEIAYVEGTPDPFLGGSYTGTEDTTILSNLGGQQDQNLGLDTVLRVGAAYPDVPTGNGRRHSLIRFDVSSLAGQYAKINSVTLRLSTAFVTGSGGTVQVFQLADANADWMEGVGDLSELVQPDIGQCTWDQKVLGFEDWAGSPGASTAGVDYLNPVIASAAFDGSTTTLDLVFSDVSLVESWISGTNAGLFLKTELEIKGNRFVCFSSEALNSSLRPQLIIDYDPIINVAIDIKPGSDDNTINLGSQGVIPVAILSSNEFDALSVDPTTVMLAGASVAVVGKANKSLVSVEDVNFDGLDDLLLKIDTVNLDPGAIQSGIAFLVGETYSGDTIEGADSITIVPSD